jgi:hypothetical protein
VEEHIASKIVKAATRTCRTKRLTWRPAGDEVDFLAFSDAGQIKYVLSVVLPNVAQHRDVGTVRRNRLSRPLIKFAGKPSVNTRSLQAKVETHRSRKEAQSLELSG